MFGAGWCAVVVATILLSAGGLRGQMPRKIAPASAGSPVKPSKEAQLVGADGQHALTAEDLGAFLDGFVPQQLHRENIAGAVVLVVKDGKVLYSKGYGYADVEKKTPVMPGGTLFRPGSVSKLFTWTAVMQLVEQGKINLDANVNDYLDFKIPDTFAKPITMRNLMTHTAGFEESVKDLLEQKDSDDLKLREYLVTHRPERVYEAGTVPAYSNYGATLAGYIVERVSGMPFDDYVERHIFEPLGMTHSTFRQPLPAGLAPMMSQGHMLGTDKAKGFESIRVVPAGSSSVTADDISRFMLAHLQGGSYEGTQILRPETVALMHSAQFAEDKRLPAMCLGFYEETRNGHRIIGHGGDTQFFHSDLHLIQDEGLGFFVSYNSTGRGETDARGALFQAFMDRYYPYSVPSARVQADAKRDAKMVAGEYILSRRPVTNILSFTGFLENPTVTAAEDGTISVDILKGVNQVPLTWVEIGPLLYREKDGQGLVAFTRDSEGRLVVSTDAPYEVGIKVGIADNKIFNEGLLGFIAIVCVGALLGWPLGAWIRRHYGRPLELSREQRRLRWAIRAVAALDVAFLICWTVLIVRSGGEPLFDAHLDPVLRVIQGIGWLGALGTMVVVYAVIKSWTAPRAWWLTRAGDVAMVVATVSFAWFVMHWHLLHWNLRY
jgi:CubicO group peptidase (beta-lactamase class C family)